jgi:hypothetical protein
MEKRMYHYATVSKAVEELNAKGFTVDFNLLESRIINNPSDFEIEHIYRYEGETDPADEATVFGIKSSTGEKGVFVAGLSASTENSATMVLNDLVIKGKSDQLNLLRSVFNFISLKSYKI